MNTKKLALFELEKLEPIHKGLKKRQETIAVAESVTSGLLQATLAQAECASEYYQGGITCYNLGQKYKHLKVEPIYADQTNCVSEKVTAEMALNVCELFNSDWGIGVTGYATPVPESGNKLFAHYAIAHKNKIVAKAKITANKDEPLKVQLGYVTKIMETLIQKLK